LYWYASEAAEPRSADLENLMQGRYVSAFVNMNLSPFRQVVLFIVRKGAAAHVDKKSPS
jgi:hypothetical protein